MSTMEAVMTTTDVANRFNELAQTGQWEQIQNELYADNAISIVLFVHGSGSSRFSPRNNYVAKVLQDVGLGTLLLDLLTDEEADDRRNVFDIPLLASRLHLAKRWILEKSRYTNVRIAPYAVNTRQLPRFLMINYLLVNYK